MKDYLYDGSFDGLLTAIFYGYQETDEIAILREEGYAPSLLTTPCFIKTESDKAQRVYQSIFSKLSLSTLENVYLAFLNEEASSETLILKYLKLCYRYSDDINLAKNNEIIRQIDLLVKRVRFEAHRFRGFVRFKEISPHIFYACIEPDYYILPLLMEHFQKRFSNQDFIIHDAAR